MRLNALLIALLGSFFIFGGVAQAEMTQELPPFEQVDQDGDGVISQEEAAMYPEIEQEMEGEEMQREDYEQLREQQMQQQ